MKKIILSAFTILMLVAVPRAFADTWEGVSDEDGNRDGVWKNYQDGTDILIEVATYNHGTLHGRRSYFHHSGKIYIETNFKDGMEDGEFRSFYDNEESSRWEEGAHTDGLKSYEWAEWHPNGQPKSISNYFRGRLHGRSEHSYAGNASPRTGQFDAMPTPSIHFVTTYKDGQHHGSYFQHFDNSDNSLELQGEHRHGLMHGLWNRWHSNGQPESDIEYRAGKMHGAATYYYPSGQIRLKTNYSQEKHQGPYVEYHDNADNTKHLEGAHRGNQRFGTWQEWSEGGILVSEITYRNGEMNGPASYFHSYDGGLDFTTVYLDGKHHGPYVKYHYPRPTVVFSEVAAGADTQTEETSTDVKQEIGEHRNNKRVGEWTQLFDNGNIEKQGAYVLGRESGTWREYDYDGELLKVSKYEKGELVSEQADCNKVDVTCSTD